jgi:hypothetical protein
MVVAATLKQRSQAPERATKAFHLGRSLIESHGGISWTVYTSFFGRKEWLEGIQDSSQELLH